MDTLSRPPHIKLQEMCDCYLETDFSKQLLVMVSSDSTDFMEDGYKYLALALLQATTETAQNLSFKKNGGFITATIETADREIELPPPSREVMGAVISIIRHIIHLEDNEGDSPLILGLKNGQLDLQVNVKKDKNVENLRISFPELESKSTSKKRAKAIRGEFIGGSCPQPGQTHWKCGECKFTFTAPTLPEKCPGCGEKCDFLNITCYTPDCGGPGNIDPRLG